MKNTKRIQGQIESRIIYVFVGMKIIRTSETYSNATIKT